MGTITTTYGNAIDVFLEQGDALIHCCNCQKTFGSGIAREIKERLPEAYQADCESPSNPLGGTSSARIYLRSAAEAVFNTKVVFNLYGQEFYGTNRRHVNYGALSNALSLARYEISCMDVAGIPTVVVPYRMASDRAGGDWDVVRELIEWYMRDTNLIIVRKQ